MGLQLMLLQLFLRILGLITLLTLHLLALGHPAALHVHLQAAVEMEALVTGLTHKALLGRVRGGRSIFLLFWQGTSLPLVVLLPGLAVFFNGLRCLCSSFVVGFQVKFITHLPPVLLSIFLSKETCIGEKSRGSKFLFAP